MRDRQVSLLTAQNSRRQTDGQMDGQTDRGTGVLTPLYELGTWNQTMSDSHTVGETETERETATIS